jgi:hypothetical protein
MKMFAILFSALVILTGICISLEPIVISQDRGIAVLAGLSDVPANDSGQNATVVNLSKQNLTDQNLSSRDESRFNQTGAGLWSWGTIPEGYELNENGTLTRLTSDQWKPSI